MPFATAAIGAVASLAGSAISGAIQGGASSSGAAASNALSQQAIADAKSYKAADQALAQPFIGAGTSATNQLTGLLGLNGQGAADSAMQAFQASPGYQYNVDQGLKAVDAGAASQGMLHSGATIKAEQTLGTNLANQDFSAYMGRLNTLAGVGLQGLGLNNQSKGQFDTLLNQQSSNQQATTNSAANNQASIYGNTLGSLTNSATGFINSPGGKNALSGLFGSGTSGGSADFGDPGGFLAT